MTDIDSTRLKSDFLNVLVQRGYVHQCTDVEALDALMAAGGVPCYIGFDATATSLHAGSLMQIMLLRRAQQCGHKPIVLMGGGTTKVGDPTGKDQQRALLTDDQIQQNIDGIRGVFDKFLTFGDGPSDAVMVNNADWLDGLGYVAFLRDFGVHFTINRMLSFDSVKLRLERESPMTFLEFNYMLMQAYDFHELYKRTGCRLQMGGSDQWGNIINGVELCRRVDGIEVFGLTTPLLTTASGAKMGKTEGGAVWLNADMLSPYDYWQYWRNTEDPDVGRFLRLFTEMPDDEIAKLEALEGQDINEAKKVLATEITALLHGRAAADQAAETARKTFEEGTLADSLPTVTVARARLDAGIGVLDLFVETGMADSKGEVRRLIKQGGVKINDKGVPNDSASVTANDLTADGFIKLSIGKKKHTLVNVG